MFFAELGLRSTIRLTVFYIKFTGQLSVAFGNYHDPIQTAMNVRNTRASVASFLYEDHRM